jgi:hypothetical protein
MRSPLPMGGAVVLPRGLFPARHRCPADPRPVRNPGGAMGDSTGTPKPGDVRARPGTSPHACSISRPGAGLANSTSGVHGRKRARVWSGQAADSDSQVETREQVLTPSAASLPTGWFSTVPTVAPSLTSPHTRGPGVRPARERTRQSGTGRRLPKCSPTNLPAELDGPCAKGMRPPAGQPRVSLRRRGSHSRPGGWPRCHHRHQIADMFVAQAGCRLRSGHVQASPQVMRYGPDLFRPPWRCGAMPRAAWFSPRRHCVDETFRHHLRKLRRT